MEDITHVGRYIVKFRYPTNKASSIAQNAVQTVQASSRETNVKSTTVVQPTTEPSKMSALELEFS